MNQEKKILENKKDRSLEELSEMFSSQEEDIGYWWNQLKTNGGSQYFRRAYCRSIFAHLEGVTFLLKQSAIESSDSNSVFTQAEKALLADEGYELDTKGRARTLRKYLPTLNNFKFAIQSFSRSNYASFIPDYGDNGWQNLNLALEIRNRLMHPKAISDLTISDPEIVILRSGYEWFRKAIIISLVESVKALKVRAGEK